MDAPCLLFDVRGKLLRMLSSSACKHFEGLAQAARHKPFGFNNKQKRLLLNLDVAFSVIRHINKVKCSDLVTDIQRTLSSITEIPCKKAGVEYDRESTGVFTTPEGSLKRNTTGAKKDIISAQAPDADTTTTSSTAHDPAPAAHTCNPTEIPCKKAGVEYSREPSGAIASSEGYLKHKESGAQKVIVPAHALDAHTSQPIIRHRLWCKQRTAAKQKQPSIAMWYSAEEPAPATDDIWWRCTHTGCKYVIYCSDKYPSQKKYQHLSKHKKVSAEELEKSRKTLSSARW